MILITQSRRPDTELSLRVTVAVDLCYGAVIEVELGKSIKLFILPFQKRDFTEPIFMTSLKVVEAV